MFGIRIYVLALDLFLLAAILLTRDVGAAEFVVVTFPLLYMILDMREDLGELERLRRRLSALER